MLLNPLQRTIQNSQAFVQVTGNEVFQDDSVTAMTLVSQKLAIMLALSRSMTVLRVKPSTGKSYIRRQTTWNCRWLEILSLSHAVTVFPPMNIGDIVEVFDAEHGLH